MRNLEDLSFFIGQYLKTNGLILSTAESCTAGLISSTIAQTSGSSQWLDSGFIVYSAEAKNNMLGVKFETIKTYDITSCEVSEEMAIGALKNSRGNISIAVTGVAGPNGGTESIPVGTVCMTWGFKDNEKIQLFSEKVIFEGDRNTIRESVVIHTLTSIELYHQKLLTKNNKNKLKIK